MTSCLGLVTFVVAAPILYGLMLLANLITKVEYSHPLFEAFSKDAMNVVYVFWIAVVLAPILEEFLFRVLLQGFLQSLAEGRGMSLPIFLFGRGRTQPAETSQVKTVTPHPANSIELAITHSVAPDENSYMPFHAELDPQKDNPDQLEVAARPWWPFSDEWMSIRTRSLFIWCELDSAGFFRLCAWLVVPHDQSNLAKLNGAHAQQRDRYLWFSPCKLITVIK